MIKYLVKRVHLKVGQRRIGSVLTHVSDTGREMGRDKYTSGRSDLLYVRSAGIRVYSSVIFVGCRDEQGEGLD